MTGSRAIRLAMTILTLALALALCASALGLLAEGVNRGGSAPSAEPIFTREAVALRLRRVAPLAGVWLLGVICAAAMGGSSPRYFAGAPEAPKKYPGDGRKTALRAALYAVAALLLAMGILNGGLNDVFVKAANICTECIGLG